MTDAEKRAAAAALLLARRKRQAQRALERAERSLTKDANAAVAQASLESVAGLGAGEYDARVAHRAVRTAVQTIAASLAAVYTAGRSQARELGREIAADQLAEDGVELAAPGFSDAAEEDASRGETAAASHAGVWGMAAMTLLRGARTRKDAQRAFASASETTSARAELAAITENADAFNAGIREAANNAVEVVAGLGRRLMREWCAELDKATCDDCFGMDGMRVPVDEEFPGGDPTRHPRCRCFVQLVVE